ncbi:WYL domain-containing protein, partial [Halomonas campaniensis]|uniref:WYL domain-containing protein n=1 Tax=Halomonas campaniensis TaxID=213554 RepID=UPI00397083FD
MDATPLCLFWKGFTVAHHEFLDPQTLRLQQEPDDRIPPVCSGCGDRFLSSRSSFSMSGSSPRLRGPVLTNRDDLDAYRVIPAPTGTGPCTRATAAASTGHPRACGDRQPGDAGACDHAGSSPRLRGPGKGFLPTAQFSPSFTQGRVEEYLHLLGTHQQLASPFTGLGLGAANTEALPMPSRVVSPQVVRQVVKASRQGQRLEVNYASFSSPTGEDRIIVPHTLVFAAGRWHVRAFCEKHRDYRDFVLSRFRGVPEPCGDMLGDHGLAEDEDWHTPVEVRLIPDRRLPFPERALIAADYGMDEGELTLSCRGPLVLYALRELGVNPH